MAKKELAGRWRPEGVKIVDQEVYVEFTYQGHEFHADVYGWGPGMAVEIDRYTLKGFADGHRRRYSLKGMVRRLNHTHMLRVIAGRWLADEAANKIDPGTISQESQS